MITPPTRTHAALDARRRTTEDMIDRVRSAITAMTQEQRSFSVQAISQRANVSRAFLYQNTRARTLVAQGIAGAAERRGQAHQAVAHAAEQAWRERALNAEDALKAAHKEVRNQRSRLAELLGRIRDLENDLPAEAAQRLVTENTTLKEQNRCLAGQNKTLTQQLTASRGNTRSLEKQIAGLQAQLLDSTPERHLHVITPAGRSPATS